MAYVYRHIRLDTGTPFYVGKGSGTRAWCNNRNRYWKNIVKLTNYKIEIITNNLDDSSAFNLEAKLIKLYRSFGYCEANLADGGLGGNSGKTRIKTLEECRKISLAKQGGKHHFAKAVKCIENDTIYETSVLAAAALNINDCNIRRVCQGLRKTCGKLTFKYV